jgi:hypothetical protein
VITKRGRRNLGGRFSNRLSLGSCLSGSSDPSPHVLLPARAPLSDLAPSWRKAIAKVEAPPKKKKADDPPPPKVRASRRRRAPPPPPPAPASQRTAAPPAPPSASLCPAH